MYAHTPNSKGEWHDLMDHLRGVSERARNFGEKFGAGDWAELAGWWHDVGKANPAFQQYLEACHTGDPHTHRGPPHSILGALWAARNQANILALIIAGHHGGLPSLSAFKTERFRPAQGDPKLSELLQHIEVLAIKSPERLRSDLPTSELSTELFLRMLYSALVDADFLDTEAHIDAGKSAKRTPGTSIEDCWEKLKASQALLSGHKCDLLNQARHEIYQACVSAAQERPGFFRLTVPTGGGKTLSGMAFALSHAIHHGLDRVIVAIPYTSIIDQNAAVYREIFGEEAVLEHHSRADWRSQDDPEDSPEAAVRQRLASENWDAPIVVTTTIQLFESLFSNRVSGCRKLHNLARSVLILDEVQTLPEGLLAPILDVLKELVTPRYGATVVFSSATQPAFEHLEAMIHNAREIVPEPSKYFDALRRVRYERPVDPWTWADLAERVREHPKALVILNRRKDALAALESLGDPEAFHLSTLLYPAHRKRVLDDIRNSLAEGKPCRLIATQVVEAGVDLDFPVVFRAMGPLDRIVQAAGRCNREDRLPGHGTVIIFTPSEGGTPRGTYAAGLGNAMSLLAGADADLHDPALYTRYFERQYQNVDTDTKRIQERRAALDYPEVAVRFRMIETPTVQVVIRKGLLSDEEELVAHWCERLTQGWCSPREALRKLQPFTVSLYQQDLNRALREHFAKPLEAGLYEWLGTYDERRGLTWAIADPADLVI